MRGKMKAPTKAALRAEISHWRELASETNWRESKLLVLAVYVFGLVCGWLL